MSSLLVVDTSSLSIPLVADAVHSEPPSEAISTLMPMVVRSVLVAGMIPWAHSFSPTPYTDSHAECLVQMVGNFLSCWVR